MTNEDIAYELCQLRYEPNTIGYWLKDELIFIKAVTELLNYNDKNEVLIKLRRPC